MDIGRTMLPNYYPRQRCGIFFVVLAHQTRVLYKCFDLYEFLSSFYNSQNFYNSF